ncbi:MAG: DNA repair protein RadA [bacterium]
MARHNSYICQSCGAAYTKWAGRCEACGEWNSIEQEALENAPPGSHSAKSQGRGKSLELVSLKGDISKEPRMTTGNGEFDRSVGGGLVPGSALLIGGEPGIGKSTLLLQLASSLAQRGSKIVYISGEEAVAQIRLRASRLNVSEAPVKLASATSLQDILSTLKTEKPEVVIIDSIQTLWSDTQPAAPGTVTQVRTCAQELVRHAKQNNCVLLLVGHVTKDGQIAGPRVVEHMVDGVLYFESEAGRSFRILRAVKNRFGAAHEIGVFDMTGDGLREVTNPSELFLSDHETDISGSAVFAGIEGTRPVLVEIQALVSPSTLGSPRRAVVGWDAARLSMLLAVLDTRCGFDFGRHDVFLNVAGGMRVSEPAADLAAIAALVSSRLDRPLPAQMAVFGEVGLSGTVRPVPQADARLNEAAKLGFQQALTPRKTEASALKNTSFETIESFVAWMRQL